MPTVQIDGAAFPLHAWRNRWLLDHADLHDATELELSLRNSGAQRITRMETGADEFALGVVVVVLSYLSLVFGELVPKSLALRHAQTYSLLIARPIQLLSWIAKPVVWLLTASSNLVLRPFSDRTDFMEARVSKEELQRMVEEAAEVGEVEEGTGELASRALAFEGLTLGEVMIPRNRIDAVSLHATPEQRRQSMLTTRRSRTVLRFMRLEHARVAVAIDEHGAMSGMVTFEDLMEELVGEVFSEHEKVREPIVRQPDGSALLHGETTIREVNRALELDLEEPEGVTTIGGLCSHLARGVPNRGARLAANDGIVLVVLDATARAVRQARLLPPAPRRADEV